MITEAVTKALLIAAEPLLLITGRLWGLLRRKQRNMEARALDALIRMGTFSPWANGPHCLLCGKPVVPGARVPDGTLTFGHNLAIRYRRHRAWCNEVARPLATQLARERHGHELDKSHAKFIVYVDHGSRGSMVL